MSAIRKMDKDGKFVLDPMVSEIPGLLEDLGQGQISLE